jgi:hypothetical protein
LATTSPDHVIALWIVWAALGEQRRHAFRPFRRHQLAV